MRSLNENGTVTSYFIAEELMKERIILSRENIKRFSNFRYDFDDEDDIKAYVEDCEFASWIPELTDLNFYQDIIDNNQDKFHTKKELKSMKVYRKELKRLSKSNK